ncbi:hypothetical protein IGD40_004164 [Salmonella enterica]|nr:hypothetical protein [Salmonella enterica]
MQLHRPHGVQGIIRVPLHPLYLLNGRRLVFQRFVDRLRNFAFCLINRFLYRGDITLKRRVVNLRPQLLRQMPLAYLVTK